MHIALKAKLYKGIIFLDFCAAFNTVNYNWLQDILIKQACLANLVQLLDALNVELCSRVLANTRASY